MWQFARMFVCPCFCVLVYVHVWAYACVCTFVWLKNGTWCRNGVLFLPCLVTFVFYYPHLYLFSFEKTFRTCFQQRDFKAWTVSWSCCKYGHSHRNPSPQHNFTWKHKCTLNVMPDFGSSVFTWCNWIHAFFSGSALFKLPKHHRAQLSFHLYNFDIITTNAWALTKMAYSSKHYFTIRGLENSE